MTDTTATDPTPAPASAPQRSVNAGHVVATGSTTALLAGVLVWISSWPLKPLDATTAADLAGLLVAACGGVMAACGGVMALVRVRMAK